MSNYIDPVTREYHVRKKMENYSAVLSEKKRLEDGHPPPLYIPQPPDQNFEIAILFILVERPNNCVSRYKINPTESQEKCLQFIKFVSLFARSICYRDVCTHFWVGGGGERTNFMLWAFPQENFPWGELVRRNNTLLEFARILI